MENEISVTDLISLAYDQKPVDFQNTFDQLIKDKIAYAIDDKKTEIAKTMFGGPEEFDDEDEEEYEDDVAFEDEEDYEFDQEEQQNGEDAE